MTTLIDAFVEMNRRADVLAVANRESAGDDMPIVNTQVSTAELHRDHVILAQAERVAKLGRKTNVHLTVMASGQSVTPKPYPPLEWFGDSALLRAAAVDGRSVHVEVLP